MRSERAIMIAVALLGLAARGTAGCATSDDGEPDTADASDNRDSSAGGTDVEDAGTGDTLDASADAKKTCSADGWCHTVLPLAEIADASDIEYFTPSLDLRDVWVSPDHEAWAVAKEGYVVHWTGGAWQLVHRADKALTAVWAASNKDVWIGGDQGLVLHGTEKSGVLVFDKVDLGSADNVVRIRGTSASDVWTVTTKSIHRLTGSAFTQVAFPNAVDDPTATQRIGDMWGRGSEIWIGARENCDPNECVYVGHVVLLRWKGDADSGADPDAGPLALWDRTARDDRGPLFPSEFQAVNVVSGVLSPDGTHLVNMHGHNSNNRWLARIAPTDAGDLDGATDAEAYAWETQKVAPFPSTQEGVWAASDRDIWLVGSPGVVRHWDGQSWTVGRVAIGHSPITRSLHTVRGAVDDSGKSDIWIVGDNIAMHRRELP